MAKRLSVMPGAACRRRLESDGCSRLVETAGSSKRGAAISHVKSKSHLPPLGRPLPRVAGAAFEAMGVSLVFHPRNPHAPDCPYERAPVCRVAWGGAGGLFGGGWT